MRTFQPALPLALASLAGLFCAFALPAPAQACGGTFCDNTGVPMPVDQRGEDILFVQDGPEIEVHVRIEYEGEAERFAWLVPLQSVPAISVGSEPLFTELSRAAAPQWILQRTTECPDDDPPSTSGGVFVPEADFAAASEPDIVLQETVGAFEVVVLQGVSAVGVVDFLIDNGYAQDPAATPIIQEYLDEGFLFAAVKLTASASTDSIHPLIFRMVGDEPCVPIRLTRIAAEQDMGVRAYFLGQERWAPQNYEHVVLNPLAIPWSELSWNTAAELQAELLSLAVDEAGGHAFATDYAGSSEVVSRFAIYNQNWDETAFVGLNMIQAIDELIDQGLTSHPLIQALLLEFMPPPDGVDPQQFWNNVEFYADQVDVENWDSAGFAAALAERIIAPALDAVDLLDAWPYLTRLHTTMSPHEMTVDPMFHPAPMLGETSNSLTAQALELCDDAGTRYWIPFGDQQVPVCVPADQFEWPDALRERAALRIEKIPSMGPPQVIEDFTTSILAGHASYMASVSCSQDGGDGDGGMEGGGGPNGEDETGGASLSDSGGKVGCACRSDERGSSSGAALGLLGLASLVFGRRRRRTPE